MLAPNPAPARGTTVPGDATAAPGQAPGAGAQGPPAVGPVPRYRAERIDSLEAFLARVQPMRARCTLPFLDPVWLRAWYETLGRRRGCEPLWIAVRREAADGGPGLDAMLLPLVVERRGPWRVASFADGGVVDYIAPLMAPDWAGTPPAAATPGVAEAQAQAQAQAVEGSRTPPPAARADAQGPRRAAQAIWRALTPVLSDRAHWLQIDKLLPALLPEDGGQAHPLALVLPLQPSRMFGNQFRVIGPWEDWRRSLPKRVRKEIERSWRVFERMPATRFEHITDPREAARVVAVLEAQQRSRMGRHGARFRLDEPAHQAFYRRLVESGLGARPAGGPGAVGPGAVGPGAGRPGEVGPVVLTVLRDDEAIASALIGMASAHRYIGLRQSIGDERWMQCSPGRLLDEQTARHLHLQDRQWFDFGIGDYAHKAKLQMQPIALARSAVALRAGGRLPVALIRLKWRLQRHPALVAAWRRLAGRAAAAPEPGTT